MRLPRPGTYRYELAWWLRHRRAVEPDDVSMALGWTGARATNTLRDLWTAGVVDQDNTGRYRLSSGARAAMSRERDRVRTLIRRGREHLLETR